MVLHSSLGRRIRESEDERNPDLLSRMKRDVRKINHDVRSMNWNDYQRYDTIIAWIDQLAADNPSVVTLTELGKSHENRRIVMAKIGRSPRGDETRAVWIDGGIHARQVVHQTPRIPYSYCYYCYCYCYCFVTKSAL